MLKFLFSDNKVPVATLNDKIEQNDFGAISDMIRQKKGCANEAIDGHFPLCMAVIADKFSITKLLLDHGANPMKTIEDSVFHDNEYLMDFCFSSKRFPFLELMVFHKIHGEEVFSYLKRTYIDEKTRSITLTGNVFVWLKKLIETLDGYYAADNSGKLKIIDTRIKRHELFYAGLEAAGEYEAALNFKQLVTYLNEVSSSLMPNPSTEVPIGNLIGDEFSASIHEPPTNLFPATTGITHRRNTGNIPSTSASSVGNGIHPKKI